MAAAFRASAQFGNGQTATTATNAIVIPSGCAIGDYCMISVDGGNDTATMTTPTGWTVLSGPDTNSTLQRSYLFGKTLASGEPGSTLTLTNSAATRLISTLLAFSGVTATGIIVATPNIAASSTAPTLPTATGVAANSAIAAFMNHRLGQTSAPTLGLPAGYTSGSSAASAYAALPNVAALNGYKIITTAGSYGGEAASSSPASTGVEYLVALAPATTYKSEQFLPFF